MSGIDYSKLKTGMSVGGSGASSNGVILDAAGSASAKKPSKADEYAKVVFLSGILSDVLGINEKNKATLLELLDKSVGNISDDSLYLELIEDAGDALIGFLRGIGVSRSAIDDLMSGDEEIAKAELIALADGLGVEVDNDVLGFIAKNLDVVEFDSASSGCSTMGEYMDAIFDSSDGDYDDYDDDEDDGDIDLEDEGLDIDEATGKASCCKSCDSGGECEAKGDISPDGEGETDLDDTSYKTEGECRSGRNDGDRKIPKGAHQVCTQGATFSESKPVWFRRIKAGRKGVNKPTAEEKKVLKKMQMANKKPLAIKRRKLSTNKRKKFFKDGE